MGVEKKKKTILSRAAAFLRGLLFLLLLGVVAVIVCNLAVCFGTKGRFRTEEELLSANETYDYVLILGCRVYSDGTPSPMLADRVTVGSALVNDGIAEAVVMSGDHREDNYNEVGVMKNYAMELGVPEDRILTDPAGLSTYDSIARLALMVSPGERVLIVTQEYHLYRALYLAREFGLDAVGVAADLRPYKDQWRWDAREVLARCKDVAYAVFRPAPASRPEDDFS